MCNKIYQKIGERMIMKKTIDLLNEVVAMGFSRERALSDIDASLDDVLGFENRTDDLVNEEISDELYDDILDGFIQEKEMD